MPIVAIHGWLDNASSFLPLSEQLTEQHIIALELAGHGHSGHRAPGEFYHYVDYLTDCIQALEALNLERCLLMGHSLGAGIAAFLAAALPDLVEKLILIEGIGPLSGEAQDMPARVRQAAGAMSVLGQNSKASYASIDAAAKRRQRAGDLSYAAAYTLTERSLRQENGLYSWRSDARLRLPSAYYFSEAQVLAMLAQIRCPSLLLRAEQGLLANYSQIDTRVNSVEKIKTVVLSGGHHLHMDSCVESAQPILEFLS